MIETPTTSLSPHSKPAYFFMLLLIPWESEKDVAFCIPVGNNVTSRTEAARAADLGSNLRCMDLGKLLGRSQPQFPLNRMGTTLLYSVGVLGRSLTSFE